MKLQTYLKSLRVIVEKDDVVRSLSKVSDEISTKVMPLVFSADAAFKTTRIASKSGMALEAVYRNYFRVRSGRTIFIDMDERLKNVRTNLDYLKNIAVSGMPDQMARNAITYRNGTVLMLNDSAAFLSRFTRKVVESIVIYETAERGDMGNDYLEENISRGEIGWVDNRYTTYLQVLEEFSKDPNTFKRDFEKLPDAIVDVENDLGSSLFARDKIDPFRFGYISANYNPLYYIGRWVAEYQVKRYKEAQEDLMRVQRRILLLEELNQGKGNPKLEAEIRENRKISSKLSAEIERFEASL